MKKTYFITGGTGSFSKNFIEILLKKKIAKKIIIFSRDEFKQFELKNLKLIQENLKLFRFFIGDVRDKDRLRAAINEEVDIVVHTAALKQVPATEYNPFETVKTNIMGAQNVIEVCLEKNISKVIALSTDKAAAPINLYGATKLVSDKLFTSANIFKGKKRCKFSVVRYGNVMGSRGSVIPLFLKQNRIQDYVTVTDKDMTRFNITLDESVKFVLKCIDQMEGGEIFIPKMPSYKILDLIKAINKNLKIKYIGIRAGEKLHEELVCESDSLNTIDKRDHYVILPSYKKTQLKRKIFSYNSRNNKNFLSIKKLQLLISSFQSEN
ncbi:UDP-N-acetylglucosamine 4,6-dehydratase [Candidatus Pelagibacter ubique]|uniref:UDP-N-acetylglucosamine 4,6-dehydratase n=1 Tax=Pelagibacter ubique TaxID=198252 RepID=A0ABX1SZ08_PELUQ|nr:UDP-N-acetylglucosamine 4,6-dehydratase (inverting) [Candidatus Pelagibacter ubique]NMN67075.1 UDP-N-acetylglucosamine 4,6-dehydratase [Candidatus Pelagibacter ubique]